MQLNQILRMLTDIVPGQQHGGPNWAQGRAADHRGLLDKLGRGRIIPANIT